MAYIPRPAEFKVELREYERGWGNSLFDTLYFDNEAEARQYVLEYNLKYNNESRVPDYYIRADYVGRVE
jgi:hypothetical protein